MQEYNHIAVSSERGGTLAEEGICHPHNTETMDEISRMWKRKNEERAQQIFPDLNL